MNLICHAAFSILPSLISSIYTLDLAGLLVYACVLFKGASFIYRI